MTAVGRAVRGVRKKVSCPWCLNLATMMHDVLHTYLVQQMAHTFQKELLRNPIKKMIYKNA